jgi:hypothetical protein
MGCNAGIPIWLYFLVDIKYSIVPPGSSEYQLIQCNNLLLYAPPPFYARLHKHKEEILGIFKSLKTSHESFTAKLQPDVHNKSGEFALKQEHDHGYTNTQSLSQN